ncbi:SMC-Scp complex subunit ScpB [Naumannella halotolerans]|uniref:SMC-Scp complex subunit ScpB n=1 Tax=Naumannella halotolerans TaxID=993414 RepID=UPI00370D7BF6
MNPPEDPRQTDAASSSGTGAAAPGETAAPEAGRVAEPAHAEAVGEDLTDQSPADADAAGDSGSAGTEVRVGAIESEQQADLGNGPTAEELSGPIEALLLMAEAPLPSADLAASLRAPVPVVEECLKQLARFYDETRRGFALRHVGGGWRLWTRAEHAEVLGQAVLEGQTARLSQAALETLAVVAYLQPVSRSRVAAVRGVNVDGVMRTLLARNLVAEVAAATGAGQAALFGTTDYFLERMGMADLSELPALAPYLPDASDLEAELGRLAGTDPGASAPIDSDSAETAAQVDPEADNGGVDPADPAPPTGPVTPTSEDEQHD